jgi:general secretion pathway protein K
MALIQALVIVAAVAAVATALMQQAERARQRLEARNAADQAALYIDGGVELVRAMLAELPQDAVIHRGQDWARPRGALEIDRGRLAYAVTDQNARFNVNALSAEGLEGDLARDAFVRLAQAQGLARRLAERMVEAMGPDPVSRARAAAPGDPLLLPLVDPRQLTPLTGARSADFADLLPFLAALPPDAAMNVNTLLPEVWAAYMPGLPRTARTSLLRRIEEAPFVSVEELVLWAEQNLPAGAAVQLETLSLGTGSTRFSVWIEARLDTVVLRRSVVLDRDGPEGRIAVILSVPETE